MGNASPGTDVTDDTGRILLEQVSKMYPIYERPIDRLKEALHPRRIRYHREFFALREVNLEIAPGETLGVIGQNGSGKSTLLQVIGGVLTPSAGRVEVSGRISSLLELGAGFNVDYSGMDNVYLFGALNGYDRARVDEKLDDILSFADIGDFIRQPVRMYSSGMYVRLAFACAVSVDPDIFIVDEALAVGDMRFTQKCFRHMRRFVDQGGTLLFVSHDMSTVRNMARRAVWIDAGTLRQTGPVREVTDHYIASMTYGDKTEAPAEPASDITQGDRQSDSWWSVDANHYTLRDGADAVGVMLRRVSVTDSSAEVFEGSELVEFALKLRFTRVVEQLALGFAVLNAKSTTLFHYNTYLYGHRMPRIEPGSVRVFRFRFRFPNLAKGVYNVYTNVVDGDYQKNRSLCMLNGICEFQVIPEEPKNLLMGVVNLEDVNFSTETCGR